MAREMTPVPVLVCVTLALGILRTTGSTITTTSLTTMTTSTTATTITTITMSTTSTTPTRACELVYLNKNPFGPQNFSCQAIGMTYIQPFPHNVDTFSRLANANFEVHHPFLSLHSRAISGYRSDHSDAVRSVFHRLWKFMCQPRHGWQS